MHYLERILQQNERIINSKLEFKQISVHRAMEERMLRSPARFGSGSASPVRFGSGSGSPFQPLRSPTPPQPLVRTGSGYSMHAVR